MWVGRPDGGAAPLETPPIVFVHGYVFASRTWQPTLERLARRHLVLAPDLTGFGWTSTTSPALDVAGHGLALLSLLDTAGIGRAVFVGTSLGSQVVAQLAVDHPDRVLGVVLVSPTFDPDEPSLPASCCASVRTWPPSGRRSGSSTCATSCSPDRPGSRRPSAAAGSTGSTRYSPVSTYRPWSCAAAGTRSCRARGRGRQRPSCPTGGRSRSAVGRASLDMGRPQRSPRSSRSTSRRSPPLPVRGPTARCRSTSSPRHIGADRRRGHERPARAAPLGPRHANVVDRGLDRARRTAVRGDEHDPDLLTGPRRHRHADRRPCGLVGVRGPAFLADQCQVTALVLDVCLERVLVRRVRRGRGSSGVRLPAVAPERDRRRADRGRPGVDVVRLGPLARLVGGDQPTRAGGDAARLVGRRLGVGPDPLAAGRGVGPVRVRFPARRRLEVVEERPAMGRGLADRRVQAAGAADDLEDRLAVAVRLTPMTSSGG